MFEVLDLIKERNLTLATGHLTPEEVLMIMAEASKRGITRIIVTHPLLGPQYTAMSLPQMQEAVKLGGAIEITAGALSRDGATKTRAIEVIKALGTQNVFVGSDSGLVGTPNHPDALAMAIKSLRAAGFSEEAARRVDEQKRYRREEQHEVPPDDARPVRDRQRTGQRDVDRRGLSVRRRAERGRRAGEHLGPRRELRVGLDADDDLPVH